MDWPPKLPKGFPLTLAPRGYMARVGGKSRWICGKKTPTDALKIYYRMSLEAANAVDAEVMPPPKAQAPDKATMFLILNRWILFRRKDCEEGKIKPHTFGEYVLSAKRIQKVVGHYLCNDFAPEHTEALHRRLLKAHTPRFAALAIRHLRDCCRYAAERRWCRPVLYGEKIVAKLVARPAVEMKWRLYTPAEVQRILAENAKGLTEKRGGTLEQHRQFHAMLYLALNGGYGSQELADLLKTDVDMGRGVIEAKRKKTGIMHTVPLWPETIEALAPVLAQRPADALLFRTQMGNPWCYQKPKIKGGKIVGTISNDNTADRFNDLVRTLGLKIEGSGFYKLRHLSMTTADAAGDLHATFALYGHALSGQKQNYVRIGEDRLRKVTEFVRQTLLHSKT